MGFEGRVTFRPKLGSEKQNAQFLRVEVGHFENGEWKVERLLNGDSTFFALRMSGTGTILHVKLMSY